LKELQDIVHELKGRGVALKATEQPVDTGSVAGKAFLDMLGVFAEFETNLRRERQLEGISAAEVQRLHGEEKLGPAASRVSSASAGQVSTACSASELAPLQ
jgi:DNA invertase Pin-like site-specific DNA recombinase